MGKKKTKFKLKKRFKKYIAYLLILAILIFYGIHVYEENLFNNTEIGQLLKKGYSQETVDLIKTKLLDQDVEYLLKEDKIDYVTDLVEDKYFIKKNFKKYLEYYENNSKKSFHDVVAIVNVGSDKKWYEEVTVADTKDKYLMLINKFHSLPENYDPGTIKKFSSTYAFGDVSAEEECYNAFIKMANDAKKDDITLVLTSGYRSYETQEKIYNDMVKQKGEYYAVDYAAKPGTSEHETGLALDIFTYGGVMETFKDTKTYEWLVAHASDYGFIERYQEGKDYLTGYSPEAWHYRYVGVETAKKVLEEGITYEEYYAFYIDNDE